MQAPTLCSSTSLPQQQASFPSQSVALPDTHLWVQAACFCAAQFLSSFPWGRISDRLGRKPMLVMSNLSSCLSVIGFGLSTSFPTAAVLRLAGGFFNCTFVCDLCASIARFVKFFAVPAVLVPFHTLVLEDLLIALSVTQPWLMSSARNIRVVTSPKPTHRIQSHTERPWGEDWHLGSDKSLFPCRCLKSMIGESCDTAAQARPLSYLSLCWGLGTVIGEGIPSLSL